MTRGVCERRRDHGKGLKPVKDETGASMAEENETLRSLVAQQKEELAASSATIAILQGQLREKTEEEGRLISLIKTSAAHDNAVDKMVRVIKGRMADVAESVAFSIAERIVVAAEEVGAEPLDLVSGEIARYREGMAEGAQETLTEA